MLQDELEPLRNLTRELVSSANGADVLTVVNPSECVRNVHEVCKEIQASWLSAFFSESGDHSLKRYFDFHQEGIREISDSLFFFLQTNDVGPEAAGDISLMNEYICSLIVHIQNHHASFFNDKLNSPLYLRKTRLHPHLQKFSQLVNRLAEATLDQALKDSLMLYFEESRQAEYGGFYTYYAIGYFTLFVEKIASLFSPGAPEDGELEIVLNGLEFNRLDYFFYESNKILHGCSEMTELQNRVNFFREKKIEIVLLSNRLTKKCLPEFPSLSVMFENWLDEQIEKVMSEGSHTQAASSANPKKKITLNLSVAQIACFIRIFHGCKVISDNALADTFRLISANFSSKMQEDISEKSLSKEYYSISQSTARRVMDIIQNLLDNLRNGFFPLLAVAGVIWSVS
ncbi:hypothetical protein [Mucilaginibacter aquaedulcis]|uniref:hypothetical protein n=1 Tax=Mucilaginibacter aquaedulcis TaxID=1187081 RepID=UPI0025B4B1B3|nr:hypothetical protein [Mucilaginibacter aquaedulcis]MDN3548909.1 hypothetical protein [Mucilaginibacter aquaedulcis]